MKRVGKREKDSAVDMVASVTASPHAVSHYQKRLFLGSFRYHRTHVDSSKKRVRPRFGGLAVAGILFGIGDHAGIENALGRPSVRRSLCALSETAGPSNGRPRQLAVM